LQTLPVRHWYGFLLSLLTALMWGILPIFLKISLVAMDSVTITWYRFTFAAVFVGGLLYYKQGLPSIRQSSKVLLLLTLAVLGLIANYVLNVQGLQFINPETAQIVIQIAPFLLMLGGIFFYKEQFSPVESVGALVLICGLALFFNDKLSLLFTDSGDYGHGIFIMFLAALSWAVYALLQKRLLRNYTAKQLTLLIYVSGTVLLLPFSELALLTHMQGLQLGALLFCCVNTLVAYGAFTEALNVWHASKVSAVIASTPLFTFISMEFAVGLWPEYFAASELNLWAYMGAILVMLGSVITAMGKQKP